MDIVPGMKVRAQSGLILFILLASLLACKQFKQSSEAEPGNETASSESPVVLAPGGLNVSGEIELSWVEVSGAAPSLTVNGVELKLEPKGGNLEVIKSGQRIAKLTREPDRIKLRGPDGNTVTHKLKFKKDGKVELEDEPGKRLYISKPKSYGYQVSDGADKSVVSVKKKEKRLEAKRESGEEAWRLNGDITPKAASVLGFEELDIELRAALMYWAHKSKL